MSIKDNRNNDVYDVLGMSEEFRRDLIDNCFNKIDVLERTGAEENDEKNSNVWDASRTNKHKKRKRGFGYFVKGAVAVFAVGCLAYLVTLGVKYYNNVDDSEYEQNVPLKKGTEIETTEYVHRVSVKGQDLDHYGISSIDHINHAFESADNEWYAESLTGDNKQFYVDDNLMEDYEEREFSYKDENGKEKKCKVVGKDFVVVSKKEAFENAKNHLAKINYIYNSGSGNQDYKVDFDKISGEQNEFSENEYVYYIQGDVLCRLKITDRVLIWKDNSCSYYELKKIGSCVYSITSGMKSFFEHNFEDANVIKPSYIELTDENTGKFEDIVVYQKFLVNNNGKVTMYYVDIDDELCRVDDVRITNYAGDKIKGNELCRILEEGLSNYMGVPSITAYTKRISSGGLIEGIDEDTNKLKVICNEYVYGENKILKHKDDDRIIYDDEK